MDKLFIYLSRSCVNALLFPAVRYSYSKLGDLGSMKAKLGENYNELGNLEIGPKTWSLQAIFGDLTSMVMQHYSYYALQYLHMQDALNLYSPETLFCS